MKSVRLFLLPAFILAFLMNQGCAPRTPMPDIKAEYYPQCYTPFKRLHDSQIALRNRTLGYTAGGTAIGAAGGALIGFLSGGSWQSALVGGLTGALSGGLTGYSLAKIQEIKDEQMRWMAYQRTMGADFVNATDVEIAALQSLKCYIQEFEHLQQDFAAQSITKEEFAKRYAEIRTGITEIGKITGDSHTLLVQREAEFRTALHVEAAKRNAALAPLPTVEERRLHQQEQKRRETAKARKAPPRSKRSRSQKPLQIRPAEENGSLALAALKTDLNRLEEQAQQDRQKYQTQFPTEKGIRPAGAETKQVSAPVAAVPLSMEQVATTYSTYPDKVLQMEAVEQQRELTLEIMSDAASKTGIDMV